MQDWQLIEKLAHQNRERIPERVVHAKGWGAHGTLRITRDISHLTRAGVLQLGAETPMIARRLFANIADAMRGVPAWIAERQIELFRQVHPDFGAGVCAALDALDPQF